jgi:Transposase
VWTAASPLASLAYDVSPGISSKNGDGHEAEPVHEEQVIGILREQEAGAKTADVCRKYGISSATFYKWKAKYGGLDVGRQGAANA